MSITIKEKDSGTALASGEPGAEVASFEGNWYFEPSTVNRDALKLTERTYTCPYKGVCHWVDYAGPGGKTVKDVAWVYADPKPGHELIKGRYGFYAGTRGATREG